MTSTRWRFASLINASSTEIGLVGVARCWRCRGRRALTRSPPSARLPTALLAIGDAILRLVSGELPLGQLCDLLDEFQAYCPLKVCSVSDSQDKRAEPSDHAALIVRYDVV